MRHVIAPQYNLVALANRVQPQDGELSAARLHRASVRARLTTTFHISSVQAMGSHARGTAIRRHSDLDVLIVLRKDEAMWGGRLVSSDTLLQRVLVDLRERFPQTPVRRDVLAAALDFGSTKQSLDVVPGIFSRFAGDRPVFLIPDGEGGWFETSPATHDSYFAREHGRSGNKLCKVSQLVKWWKHGRLQAQPVRSFYVDMVLAGRGLCLGAKTYAQCLCDLFETLVDTKCGAFADPCGIAGQIAATNTMAQREALYRAAQYARDHARSAMTAEARLNYSEANRQWDLVFNGAY